MTVLSRTLTLTLLLILTACEGGRGGLSTSSRDTPESPDNQAATGQASTQYPQDLQSCFVQATDPTCAISALKLAPDQFFSELQNCTPDESGFNCVFNAAFDHLGGVELAQVLNIVADACISDPTDVCKTVNDALPDVLPILSLPTVRGTLVRHDAAPITPSLKVVDGDPADWQGVTSGIAGSAYYSAGEHIYTDYLYDAYGADDGDDWRRLQLLGPIIEIQARARRLDQLSQALGDQLDVPRPIGADDSYGNRSQGDGVDLQDVRWALQGQRLYLLNRFSKLTEAAQAHVLVLIARDPSITHEPLSISETGLNTSVFDVLIDISAAGIQISDLHTGAALAADAVSAINPQGWINTLEAAFDLSALGLGDQLHVALLSLDAEGQAANVAYRLNEPVAGIYNEQQQAIALYEGSVDRFVHSIDLAALAAGRTEHVAPGPGYHERQFHSGDNIAVESGEYARAQRYGLYVPDSYNGAPTPISYWLHYRGGKAHSGAAWTPRLITELGVNPGHIVATPHGRSTSGWYTTDAHQDFFEVKADVESLLAVDSTRRYLSGYSMGGYGTYLFGLLYPDLFAAGYSTSGAPTQGAWTGVGPDIDQCLAAESEIPTVGSGNACFIQANEGDANAQLNFRILENAQHFPIAIHHGTNDELVPSPGVERFGLRLLELGYRYDLLSFIGYEHFSQAIMDEWAEGAYFMHSYTLNPRPRQITYKVVPALVHALNTVRPDPDTATFNFQPDGAWWVDGLVVANLDPAAPRDTSVWGMIKAVSLALPDTEYVAIPRLGLINFGSTDGIELNLGTPVTAVGHSTPFLRHGQDWVETGDAPISNAFTATLTNLQAATLDIAGMGLDLSLVASGSINTSVEVQLTLRSLTQPVSIRLDGETVASGVRDALTISLSAGEHVLELQP